MRTARIWLVGVMLALAVVPSRAAVSGGSSLSATAWAKTNVLAATNAAEAQYQLGLATVVYTTNYTTNVVVTGAGSASFNGTYGYQTYIAPESLWTNSVTPGNKLSFSTDGASPSTLADDDSIKYLTAGINVSNVFGVTNVWATTNGTNPAPSVSVVIHTNISTNFSLGSTNLNAAYLTGTIPLASLPSNLETNLADIGWHTRRLYNQVCAMSSNYFPAQASVVLYGDSMVTWMSTWMGPAMQVATDLQDTFGVAGVGGHLMSYSSAIGPVISHYHTNLFEYTNWLTGAYYEIQPGGMLPYAAYGNGFFQANRAIIWYIVETNGGTITVKSASATTTNSLGSFSCAAAERAGAVTNFDFATDYVFLKLTNSGASGTAYILGTALIDTNKPGVVIYQMGYGGIELTNTARTPASIMNPIIRQINPDLVISEFKETSTNGYHAALGTVLNLWNSVTNSDWLYLASSPTAGDTTGLNPANNAVLRAFAATNGQGFFDGYRIYRDLATVTNLNWGSDYIHYNQTAQRFAATRIDTLIELPEMKREYDRGRFWQWAGTNIWLKTYLTNLHVKGNSDVNGSLTVSNYLVVGNGVTAPTNGISAFGPFVNRNLSVGMSDNVNGVGNYVSLGADGAAGLLLGQNLYTANGTPKIFASHATLSGVAIRFPGNAAARQGGIEFYTRTNGSVTAGATYGMIPTMFLSDVGFLGVGNTNPSTMLVVNSNAIIGGTLTTTNPIVAPHACLILSTQWLRSVASSSTYYVISNMNYSEGFQFGLNPTFGTVTNLVAGTYRIFFQASYTGQNSHAYEAGLFTNGVECPLIEFKRTMGSAASIGSASASGIISLPANTAIDVRMQDATGTGDATIEKFQFTVGTP